MKKIIFISLIISLFFSCKSKNESVLIFDSEPAEKFIEVIDYIEKSSNQKLIFEEFSPQIITANYIKNKTDTILNTKINNLLKLPAYNKLSEGAIAYTDTSKIKGKDAYKLAFFNLPYYRTRMNGDRVSAWINYWENNYNLEASNFLKELNLNSKKIKNSAIKLSNKYYPSNIVKIDSIKTIFCMDGYRSSFTFDNIIYMELVYSTHFNIDKFTKILSHELHHINYSNWLLNKIKITSKKQEAIFKFQRKIILEGIAQQINFVDYNAQVKKLYNNKKLLTTLNKNFINNLISISKSKIPLETFQETMRKMWQTSDALLEEYCKEDYEEHTISHRPTFLYYISYHLYNAIEENGKNNEIKFVIEHPESLLEIYNKLRNKDNIIPKYSDEIVALWKNNFT